MICLFNLYLCDCYLFIIITFCASMLLFYFYNEIQTEKKPIINRRHFSLFVQSCNICHVM